MMRVPVIIAALLLAAPASAATFQITGSAITSCERHSVRNFLNVTPCSLTHRLRTAHALDGWFSFNDSLIDATGKHTIFADGVSSPNGSYNTYPSSAVDFHIPWAEAAPYLSMRFNTDGSLNYWFMATDRGSLSVSGSEGSPDPKYDGWLEAQPFRTSGSGNYIFMHGDSGHMTQIADGTGTLPPAPVPLPASAALLLGGIASVFALRRRSAL